MSTESDPKPSAAYRARRACQILVDEIGSDGPADVDDVAERAVAEIQSLRKQVSDLRAATEESEHAMHLRIRASYDKTIADCWRAKVAEVERERDELRATVADLQLAIEIMRRLPNAQAAADIGREVAASEAQDACAEYAHWSTRELQDELRALETTFDAAGGRGVELADDIDRIRIALSARN